MKKSGKNLVSIVRYYNFAYRKNEKQVDLIIKTTTRKEDFFYLNLTKDVKSNQY